MANESSIKPLILNLLAEEQLAEIKKARDPVKMAIAIAMMILVITTLSGSALQFHADAKQKTAAELARRHSQLTTMTTSPDIEALKVARAYSQDVLAINRGRALYASKLSLIKEIIPDSIQLTRVTIGIISEAVEAPPPPPDTTKKVRRPAIPPSKDCVELVIDGRASSLRPEIEVDNFLQAMREDPRLKDEVEYIKLRSIAPGAAAATVNGAGPALNNAAFVIECRYKELTK